MPSCCHGHNDPEQQVRSFIVFVGAFLLVDERKVRMIVLDIPKPEGNRLVRCNEGICAKGLASNLLTYILNNSSISSI